MTRETLRWWEASADDFQAAIDLSVEVDYGFGAPPESELGLLGDVSGTEVVEPGCGGGQITVALAEQGAEVVGVDLSAAQLDHATDLAADHATDLAADHATDLAADHATDLAADHATDLAADHATDLAADHATDLAAAPRFVRGDVTDLPLPADRFDLAVNAYVYQWVERLDAAVAEVARVLRDGGRFVCSLPHPYFELLDSETGEVAESYFGERRTLVEDPSVEADLVLYRHTIGDLHRAFTDAGFVVERLLEPGSPDPDDYEPGPWGEHPPELMSKVPATVVVAGRLPG